MHRYKFIYACIGIDLNMHTYIYIYIYVHRYAFTYAFIDLHLHMPAQLRVYICIQICIFKVCVIKIITISVRHHKLDENPVAKWSARLQKFTLYLDNMHSAFYLFRVNTISTKLN